MENLRNEEDERYLAQVENLTDGVIIFYLAAVAGAVAVYLSPWVMWWLQ
jgi:hypothetical protein